MQPSHLVCDCESQYKCNKCQGRHNISLCNDQAGNQTNKDEETIVNSVNASNSDILLQTGKANVINPDTSSTVECRILFDSGSQRSYITSSESNKLKLSPIRKEKVLINTFGDMNTGIKEIDVVRVKIASKMKKYCGFF